ncbi:MAG: thiamine diphosphokinase [Eubacterium sp.]|nr:thiamine diphosphokinase [Eubacterium sp.]
MAKEVKRCTVVSGAPVNDCEFLKENINTDSFIIAADSGYKRLVEAGLRIDCIIADFDSSKKPELDCEIIEFSCEKEFTDTFNAVRLAVERGYNDITVFFALGGRFDHSYSNLLCLAYCNENGVKCTLFDRNNRVSLINSYHKFKKDYESFSLFAFMGECRGVSIKGAYYTAGWYNKDKLDFKISSQFAQSNFITDEYCEISVENGTLLLIEANDVTK